VFASATVLESATAEANAIVASFMVLSFVPFTHKQQMGFLFDHPTKSFFKRDRASLDLE